MKSQLFDIRREYKKGRLTPGNLNDNPFEQFDHWLNDAIHSDEYEPTAMTVATVSSDGHPSTRTVLLKGVENGRFIFFTNYESRKGRQLTALSFPLSESRDTRVLRTVQIDAVRCSVGWRGRRCTTFLPNILWGVA